MLAVVALFHIICGAQSYFKETKTVLCMPWGAVWQFPLSRHAEFMKACFFVLWYDRIQNMTRFCEYSAHDHGPHPTRCLVITHVSCNDGEMGLGAEEGLNLHRSDKKAQSKLQTQIKYTSCLYSNCCSLGLQGQIDWFSLNPPFDSTIFLNPSNAFPLGQKSFKLDVLQSTLT